MLRIVPLFVAVWLFDPALAFAQDLCRHEAICPAGVISDDDPFTLSENPVNDTLVTIVFDAVPQRVTIERHRWLRPTGSFGWDSEWLRYDPVRELSADGDAHGVRAVWNMRNSEGGLVADGTYTIHAVIDGATIRRNFSVEWPAVAPRLPTLESAGWLLLRRRVRGRSADDVMASVGSLRGRVPASHRAQFDAGVEVLGDHVSGETGRLSRAFQIDLRTARNRAIVEVYSRKTVREILELGYEKLLAEPTPSWMR